MKLEEYVKEIKDTPERFEEVKLGSETRSMSNLTMELGMYDNYSVLLRGNLTKVEDFFRKKGYKKPTEETTYFNHAKGLGSLSVSEGMENAHTLYVDENDPRGKELLDKMGTLYNISVMFHPFELANPPKKMRVSQPKACAIMVMDLVECIKQHQISACFLTSTGWNHEGDFSRIVFYEPKEEQVA